MTIIHSFIHSSIHSLNQSISFVRLFVRLRPASLVPFLSILHVPQVLRVSLGVMVAMGSDWLLRVGGENAFVGGGWWVVGGGWSRCVG